MALNSSALAIGSPGFQTLIQTDRQFVAAALDEKFGILGADSFKVTANATSHAVDIESGKIVLPGSNAQDQGSYFAWSEAGETMAWPAPSANPRIDTLVCRVADPQYGTVTGQVGGRFDIIMGVPAATPAARSDTEINTTFFVPGAWLRIADVRVNVADTGAIPGGQVTDRRRNPDGWTTWTPVLTGVTLGSGTVIGRYKKINSTMTAVQFLLTFASNTSITALVVIAGLPFTVQGTQSVSGYFSDSSASDRWPVCGQSVSNSLASRVYVPMGGTGLSNSSPVASWGTGDALQLSGILETVPW